MFASLCAVAYTKYPEFAGYYVFYSANLQLTIAILFSLSSPIISFSTLCLYNELIAARVCFSNHNVDKHKIRAQTPFTKNGRQLEQEKNSYVNHICILFCCHPHF